MNENQSLTARDMSKIVGRERSGIFRFSSTMVARLIWCWPLELFPAYHLGLSEENRLGNNT
jgi:hypothetical protein